MIFENTFDIILLRFPENYCFKLTDEEYGTLRCQNVTSKKDNRGGRQYLPYAFTEYGITMLAGLLKSDVAIKMSLKIVDTFISMRKYISNNLLEQRYINNLVLEDHKKIKLLEASFDKMEIKKNNLFFKGQVYDAYSLLIDILIQSKKEIVIIDNYIDKSLLDILTKTKKKIKVVTNEYNNQDYNKYKSQYNNINLVINNTFHDRFIITDRKTLYHCGASFKDLGKRCFEITKIEEPEIIKKLLNMLQKNSII